MELPQEKEVSRHKTLILLMLNKTKQPPFGLVLQKSP